MKLQKGVQAMRETNVTLAIKILAEALIKAGAQRTSCG